MLETDYPHSDSTWPDTQDILVKQFADIPDEEAEKITHLNARALYRLA
jgi:predicted TIM-barrel fold metal-dependent hydrolase